jgi:hypothetical protein
MEAVKAVAISDIVLFWTVELIAVPVTTGFPLGKEYDPLPFLGISTPTNEKSPFRGLW